MKRQIELSITQIEEVASAEWKRNSSLYLPGNPTILAWVVRKSTTPLLIIVPDDKTKRDLADDLKLICDKSKSSVIKSIITMPDASFGTEGEEEMAKLVRGNNFLQFKQRGGVLCGTPSSFILPFKLGSDFLDLHIGQVISREFFTETLLSNGYTRSDLVWKVGQVSVRGSVIDVFSPDSIYPLRIEFFDDEIESLRFFSTESQRKVLDTPVARIQNFAKKETGKLLELLPKDVRIIFVEPQKLEESAENYVWLYSSHFPKEKIELSFDKFLLSLADFPRLRITHNLYDADMSMPIWQFENFRGRLKSVEASINFHKEKKNRIFIVSAVPRIVKWAEAKGLPVIKDTLTMGFTDNEEKIAVLTDFELTGVSLKQRSEARAPSDWENAFEVGQYVLHKDHGVAIYQGLTQVTISGNTYEYLVLQYAEEKKILVPFLEFYKVEPWSPLPGKEPKVDSLSSRAWSQSIEVAREKARQAAIELMQIYASREVSSGNACQINEELMAEVVAGFPFTETKDQLEAISEVLSDMSRATPMDRLLVGDVGFGKTEVAIRAAAMAVFSGKQVVIMAPTTILANQHYETFSKRFAEMGVNVAQLSRFVPQSKQKIVKADLKSGLIDIVVGTHMLLSRTVDFKDLGLVVVDEEHRFGVLQKEKLKKKFPGVDFLMLSATPIPRSLSMSLSGLRDISLLATPPQRRLPVITITRKFSEFFLKEAVLREVSRGGQIFYVHNRIFDIHERFMMLKRLFPSLTIAVAHGRLSEAELEDTMEKFVAGKIDLLLSTSIVENGLDIPGANTLIVDDAEELGLASMYQLRGRVGRRETQAYAYLFYSSNKIPSKNALERLEALASLDELGSGYKLAQRDLEIRGAGDLIGTAQHGNSDKVGYQAYCDIMSEEIAKLKGTYNAPLRIDVGFAVSIPKYFLPQESLRVTLYRRMLKVESIAEVFELRQETQDRFGTIPRELDFLFNVAIVRGAKKDLSAISLTCEVDRTILECSAEILAKLKIPRTIYVKGNCLITRGGYEGVATLAKFLVENFYERKADSNGKNN